MAGPWEKYQQAAPQGPWSAYQGAKQEEVVNERHPDVGVVTRAVFKNFANENSDTAFNYLQKQHPDLNFKKSDDGDILVQGGSGGQKWMKLDPTNKWYAPELEDISDAAFGLVQGTAETGASALGGIGGGLAGLATGPAAPVAAPVLALGTAGAAGAATGASMDALRQKIGQWAGIPQEFDMESVEDNAKWGAVSPLLLGTGAAGKTALKAGGKQLLKAQSGLLNRGFQGAKGYIAPRLGQLASGIDKDTLKYARNNLDKIEAAEQSATGGAEIYGELSARVKDSLQTKLDDVGEQLRNTGGSDQIKANIADVEAPMRELLQKYEQKALKSIEKHGDDALNKADVQNFEYLQQKLNPYMEGSGELRGYDLKGYLDNLNEITQISKNVNLATKPTVDKDLIRVSRQASKILDDQASQGPAGEIYKGFKNEYSQLKSIEKNVVNKWFKDDQATERTLNNLLSRKNKARKLDIYRAMEKLETPVDDTAKESIANTLFVDPSMDVLSTMGTTSTSRSVPLGGIGGTIGYVGGSQAGMGHGGSVGLGALLGYAGSKVGSPYTMRKFMEADRLMGRGANALQNMTPIGAPQATINTWQQLQSQP